MTRADTAPVRAGEELDLAALRAYLHGKVPGDVSALEAEQFPGGFSNLTYLLRLGTAEYVLRRAPLGPVAAKAHDMAREYHLLGRVAPVFPAAPTPVLLCEDAAVIGATFYLMERRRGVIIRTKMPREYADVPHAARKASETLVDTLADLHAVDIHATGLSALGKPEGFNARQVEGWAGRWRRARTDDTPGTEVLGDEAVIAWLTAHTPAESAHTLVHNDYKLDNLMLDAHDPARVVALLDWEMTTVGDPLVDLGLTLCYWTQRGFPDGFRTPIGEPGAAMGFLTRAQFLDRYAQRSGRDLGNIVWYEVLGVFKLAVIVQQIYARYHAGQTNDPRFAHLGRQAQALIREAQRQLETF
ncbi:phosphotransferase family protein [Deinococcus maricopensis]|uniref:Aminoglycoside phosphotransferase n=1 Tax=Deinococcus maricopensis (strain DSM 21211 / LMG 22137 / NRRL B-23946 / LB-34) TaxID=709986 RepID=E8U733_DEIML|nr:phosphotransferase family protein [Deinococcus maricopensis]ADV66872.1 aminoglycoside phosphotransferase [Deinococcus maricopensis DSM 21211]